MNMQERLLSAYNLGYRAQPDGSVLSPSGEKVHLYSKEGYMCFCVSGLESRYKSVYVHRLVALQKFGAEALLRPGIQVRHMNGSSDNSFANIEIGNNQQNSMDKPPEVRLRCALVAAKKLRKLSEEQVQEIRDAYKRGVMGVILAERYGLAKSTVSYIVRGVTYNNAEKL